MATPEDDLLVAVADALGLASRIRSDIAWSHVRRSDRALVMGTQGLPDIVGVIGDTLIAWELKSEHGSATADQAHFLALAQRARTIDARVIRPTDQDVLIRTILGDRMRPR